MRSWVTYVSVGPRNSGVGGGLVSPRGDWSRLGWLGFRPTFLTMALEAAMTICTGASVLACRRWVPRLLVTAVGFSVVAELALWGRPLGTLGPPFHGVVIDAAGPRVPSAPASPSTVPLADTTRPSLRKGLGAPNCLKARSAQTLA